ncbi:uncharacterized protein LOC133340327 [Lethenteron reissneri]|uniref:uncharacterized protein LOC133340327 n=1 Tax=Lethenteron reissneri TaxID=7753 RepID=UPI002AB788A5|nr:uncharacterized protein LOC133340327 [Lethenteron reissneri]
MEAEKQRSKRRISSGVGVRSEDGESHLPTCTPNQPSRRRLSDETASSLETSGPAAANEELERAWLVDESNIVRSRAANSFGSPNGMGFALRARMHNRVAREHAGHWPPATIATAATTASRLCHSTLATEGTHVPGFARRQPGDWSHFPGAPPAAAAAAASTHAATCQASRLAERQGARLKSRELKAAVQIC